MRTSTPILATLVSFITLSCTALPNETEPTEPSEPSSGSDRVAATNAFVLAHGFGGDREMGFGNAVAEAMSAAGHQVFKAEVSAVESIAVRAAALKIEIDGFMASSGAQSVHIIGHSMGGLDSRYLISTLGYADKVKSLTTISTPHQGTPLADVALDMLGGSDQQDAQDALADLLAGTILDPAAFQRGVFDLAEANAPAFNAANPDAPGVKYISYAGLSSPGGIEYPDSAILCAAQGAAVPAPDQLRPLLFLPAPIVTGTDLRPNDGVVPVDSAIWGEFRGCIPADHIDENGALDTGNSGIDAPLFYTELANELAAMP